MQLSTIHDLQYNAIYYKVSKSALIIQLNRYIRIINLLIVKPMQSKSVCGGPSAGDSISPT